MVKKQEKQQKKQDIKIETTYCLTKENLWAQDQSKLAWKKERKLAELEDKKAKQVFFLKIKKMELLKDGIFILFFKKQKSNLYKLGISYSFFLMKKLLIFWFSKKNTPLGIVKSLESSTDL